MCVITEAKKLGIFADIMDKACQLVFTCFLGVFFRLEVETTREIHQGQGFSGCGHYFSARHVAVGPTSGSRKGLRRKLSFFLGFETVLTYSLVKTRPFLCNICSVEGIASLWLKSNPRFPSMKDRPNSS